MAPLNLKMVKLFLIFVYLMPGYFKANGRCLRTVAKETVAKETCPAGWSKWGNHCYKVIESLEWANAKDKCIEIGGVMATPNTWEEHSHLNDLERNYFWIDCNDIQEEGTWECKDGATDVDFRKWQGLQPDGGSLDNCVMVSGSFWYDRSCDSKLSAVCKQSVA